METYEKYKPSGIEWIGEVPEHWEVNRVKLYFRIISGSGFKLELQGEKFGDYPVCKASDISAADYKIQVAANYISKKTAKEAGFTVIPKGSVLFAKIGEAMRKNNRVISTVDCCVDNNCQGMVPKNINPFFGYYLFRCIDMGWFDNGGTIPCINNQKLLSSRIPIPTINEQASIVSYLDARCADIDKVVATQEKRIALLKELKQSVITQAVTSGLNPDAKMMDSGVEWIGEVPEHWEKCRFKNFMVLMVKPSQSSVKVGLENIESQTGSFIETDTEFEGNGTEFQKGDIVYGKLRPYLQKVWLAEFDGNAVGDFFVFRSRKNSDSKYLKYLLLSDGFTKEANSATEGAKMPRVSSEFILTLNYFLPPYDEQKTIADYVEKRCLEIDQQINGVTRQIDLLREYKQSLITEVVTGKRKVC